MDKIFRLVNTVKYLKFIQVYYRLFYFLRAKFRKATGFKYQLARQSEVVKLNLQESIKNDDFTDGSKFFILNIKSTGILVATASSGLIILTILNF